MIGALEKLPRVAYPPELKILTESARTRVLAAQKAQDYYDGNFWRYIESEVIEWGNKVNLPERNTGHDYHGKGGKSSDLDYVPTKLELRYPKFFIDELASWMFENPIGLQTSDESYYQQLGKMHKKNKLDMKLLQSGAEGCLTGGVAAKVLYNTDLKQTRIILRPSRECFPIMNPDDVEIMEKVHFCVFQDDEKTVWRQTFELREGICWVTEALFDISKIGDKGEAKPKEILRGPEPLYSGDKPIDFLPVVIIPNEPNLGETFGISDLEPLYQPINEVCRKYSDSSDALRFELFPIKLIMNIEESNIEAFKVSPGAVWSLVGGDPDHPADAKNLESNMSNMEYLFTHVDRLLDMLHEFSGVPRVTKDTQVGNISGVAIKLMFTQIISKCNRKTIYWQDGLKSIYDYALRTAKVYEGFNYDPEKLDLEIQIKPRIPQNELEQLEIQAKRIEMLTKSIVDTMKEQGVENPEEELAKTLAERAQIDTALNPDFMGQQIANEAGGGNAGPQVE